MCFRNRSRLINTFVHAATDKVGISIEYVLVPVMYVIESWKEEVGLRPTYQ